MEGKVSATTPAETDGNGMRTSSGSDSTGGDGTQTARNDVRKATRKYTELVPSLNSTDDLLWASERSSGAKRLLVVKFYSKKCRMCYRIAAKYRRLALDYQNDIDCYESASDDARQLFEALNVTQVPSVQIFDGRRVTRLADFSAKPTEWKKLLSKVDTAIKSMQKRRDLHDIFGTQLIDDLQEF